MFQAETVFRGTFLHPAVWFLQTLLLHVSVVGNEASGTHLYGCIIILHNSMLFTKSKGLNPNFAVEIFFEPDSRFYSIVPCHARFNIPFLWRHKAWQFTPTSLTKEDGTRGGTLVLLIVIELSTANKPTAKIRLKYNQN